MTRKTAIPVPPTRRLGMVFSGGERLSVEQCRALFAEAEAAGSDAGTPLLAAADEGFLAAEAAGIQPDWIVGDMDSLGNAALSALAPERVLRYPREKDHTDTELAFSLLREKGCGRIWIIGGGGGRIDHLFAIRSLFERAGPPERWSTSGEDMYCLGADGFVPALFRSSRAASPVSVFPLGGGPWEAESSGLKWPLAGLAWNRGFFGLSNEASGAFSLEAKSGRFLVILPSGGGKYIQLEEPAANHVGFAQALRNTRSKHE